MAKKSETVKNELHREEKDVFVVSHTKWKNFALYVAAINDH